MTPIVLAFDIANHTAWSKVRLRKKRNGNEPEYQVVDAGAIILPHDAPEYEQLECLRRAVLEVVNETKPTLIIYEKVPATWKGSWQVGHQHEQYGVFLAAASVAGVPIMNVAPTKWQRDMLPYIPNRRSLGNYQVRKRLKALSIEQARLRAGCETDDDNIADSVCIGIWGLRQWTMTGGSDKWH